MRDERPAELLAEVRPRQGLAQRRALESAGCTEIIEEQASGRKARPALAELVEKLGQGDTVTVFRFDRISRSVADFYAIGERIRERGASLRSLAEQFDTSTPMGRAMMGFAAIWAELEAETAVRLSAELRRLADWLGLADVVVADRGTLASALSTAA